jgi:hypothetical protein
MCDPATSRSELEQPHDFGVFFCNFAPISIRALVRRTTLEHSDAFLGSARMSLILSNTYGDHELAKNGCAWPPHCSKVAVLTPFHTVLFSGASCLILVVFQSDNLVLGQLGGVI